MSTLVNDFLIEPVLRRARHFSRSNTQNDRIHSHQQSISTNQNENTSQDPARQSELIEIPQVTFSVDLNTENAVSMDSRTTTCSPTELDIGSESTCRDRESINLLNAPESSHDLYETQEDTPSTDSEHGSHILTDNLTSDGLAEPSLNIATRTINDSIDSYVQSNMTVMSDQNSTSLGLPEESSQDINHARRTSLPENDGMGQLRQQILSIQEMDIKTEQKALLMHQLLTRNYSKAQTLPNSREKMKLLSPSTVIKQEKSSASGSISSFLWQLNGSLDPTAEEKNHTFKLSADDLKQTYVPFDTNEYDDCVDTGNNDEYLILGCKHYRRNVKLQCSTCERWYTCRLCHDQVEDHTLDRKATKNMLCMICGCAQKAGEFCVECGERSAWYYCNICKLWDNDTSKNIYHCNDCGICRKGLGIGKDFFHCKTCGTCMSMSVAHSHKCIERVSDCNCPICGEYMFDSPLPVVFMLCGHGIHRSCYKEHLKTSYKCPICSKSTKNMEAQFRNLDLAIISQPMPSQFRDTRAMVSCNDCCAKSAVNYHWLGLKCAICDSYNTVQLSTLSSSAEANHNPITNSNNYTSSNFGDREASSPQVSSTNIIINRRYSTNSDQEDLSDRNQARNSSNQGLYSGNESVFPSQRVEFFNEETSQLIETDDSAGEDDELDFWGLDEPRSVTSGENCEEVEENDSEDSSLEDCDDGEEEDEEEDFALFGHR